MNSLAKDRADWNWNSCDNYAVKDKLNSTLYERKHPQQSLWKDSRLKKSFCRFCIFYIGAFTKLKASTSINHCKNDGALINFQLKRISLAIKCFLKKTSAYLFTWLWNFGPGRKWAYIKVIKWLSGDLSLVKVVLLQPFLVSPLLKITVTLYDPGRKFTDYPTVYQVIWNVPQLNQLQQNVR